MTWDIKEHIPKSAYEDYGYTPPVSKPSNNNSSKTTLTKEQKEIAKQLGYEENSSITEEETGKFEASDVGTADGIYGHSDLREETKSNDNKIIDYVVGYGIEETVSNAIENILQNSDEIIADFTQKAIVALGVSYPTLSGQKILYPFKDTLIGANKVADNISKLLGTSGTFLAQAGSSALIGTIVSSEINIANGQDWTEAIPEAIVKSVPVAAIMVLVGNYFVIPGYVAVGASFLLSRITDNIFDSNIFGIKSITERVSEQLNVIVEKTDMVFQDFN